MDSLLRTFPLTRTVSWPPSDSLLKSTTTRSRPVGSGFVCTSTVSAPPFAIVLDFAPWPPPLSTNPIDSSAVPDAALSTDSSASTRLPFGIVPLNAMIPHRVAGASVLRRDMTALAAPPTPAVREDALHARQSAVQRTEPIPCLDEPASDGCNTPAGKRRQDRRFQTTGVR
jgi:hypothetical protein